jgi:hypothetical protein
MDPLGQAIAKLFEPALRCKEHLAEIAKASDSIFQLVGSALERLEELESFRDHMRRLSNSFASMRAFQDDLGVLAESFEPVKALHQQIIQLADAVRTCGSGGIAETSQCLAGADCGAYADSAGRYGTPGPILRTVESVWGPRSGERCER